MQAQARHAFARASLRGLAALAALLTGLSAAPASAESLELIGRFDVPSGLKLRSVGFGGFSALDYDAENDRFYALSDDDGAHGSPRFYELSLALGADGISGLDVHEQRPILSDEDAPYPNGAVDPQALRLGRGGALFWAQGGGVGGAPSVGVMGLDGRQIAAFELPAYYARSGEPGQESAGVLSGHGFKALALGADGAVLVAAERALAQDVAASAGAEQPELVRILALSAEEGRAAAEYVYPLGLLEADGAAPSEESDTVSASDDTDAEPAVGATLAATSPSPTEAAAEGAAAPAFGLVELLARPDGGFYALERSHSVEAGGAVALYRTSFDDASNVLGSASLSELAPTPMRKELVLSLDAREGMGNFEALSLGPEIDGAPSLLLMSDDGFAGAGQSTQILLFAIR